MKVSELRICNLYKPTDGSGEYKEATSDDIKAWSMGAIYGKEIPFTKEWSLKFGFGKDGEAPNRIVIESELGKVMVYTDGSIPVHRFQNIYFDLMGSELTIKETVQK